jgi:hypothetical protein
MSPARTAELSPGRSPGLEIRRTKSPVETTGSCLEAAPEAFPSKNYSAIENSRSVNSFHRPYRTFQGRCHTWAKFIRPYGTQFHDGRFSRRHYSAERRVFRNLPGVFGSFPPQGAHAVCLKMKSPALRGRGVGPKVDVER